MDFHLHGPYLEAEPQSSETKNAVELFPARVKALAIRLSPAAKQEAIKQAGTAEAAKAIAQLTTDIGMSTVTRSISPRSRPRLRSHRL